MATKELSLLLFNVGHGPVAGNAIGITDDQVAGIEAVLSSDVDKIKKAKHLYVLASDEGQCSGSKLIALKTALGIQEDSQYTCINTVGIFPRSPTRNFATLFLESTDRASFAKVTVPLNGGNVNVLLVSYHGPHTGATLVAKQRAFSDLITTSDTMKRENGCEAVIIGGDFNLPMSEAKLALRNLPANAAAPTVHFARNDFESSIDFVVYWPDTHLGVIGGHPKVLKWRGETFNNLAAIPDDQVVLVDRPRRSNPGVEPFDHPRLLYRFNVSRPN